MKHKLSLGILVIFSLSVAAIPAAAQGNTSVLFDGTALAGKTNFLVGDSGLNQMKPKNAVFPGVEVRFNQKGRFTFGLGYQKMELEGDPKHYNYTFCSTEGNYGVICAYDSVAEVSANAVIATTYVNFVRHGKVRPFIGFGGGIALFNETRRMYNRIGEEDGKTLPDATKKLSTANQVLIKGVAGVNIYPVKYVVLSLGGGFINGAALTLGAGFTF